MGNQNWKNRDLYLNRLIRFQDSEPIKVITGIRRCGKSVLMKLMIRHLLNSGIGSDQILEMNFESLEFGKMDFDELYHYVKDRILPSKRMYLFFDEIQRIPSWEKAVNSFRVDFDCDIYITGSNAYLLSSEYATYLSGRCVEIKMLPLSFNEFVEFQNLKKETTIDALGRKRFLLKDEKSLAYQPEELFESYLRFGGMPSISDFGLEQEKAMALWEGLYSTVVVRDILEREKRKGQAQISDPFVLRKLILFLAGNIGSSVSLSNVGNVLVHEGLLLKEGAKKPSTHTIQAYVDALLESYFFYEIKRFDIRGKEYLKTLGKYYIVDIGLRNYLLGYRDLDRGHILENVVYFEWVRRGYDVAIGKMDNQEIDFIATNLERKVYVQVTESMDKEEVRQRELAPLQKIKDNYEKIVLTLDRGPESSFGGIRIRNIVDWLLSE